MTYGQIADYLPGRLTPRAPPPEVSNTTESLAGSGKREPSAAASTRFHASTAHTLAKPR